MYRLLVVLSIAAVVLAAPTPDITLNQRLTNQGTNTQLSSFDFSQNDRYALPRYVLPRQQLIRTSYVNPNYVHLVHNQPQWYVSDVAYEPEPVYTRPVVPVVQRIYSPVQKQVVLAEPSPVVAVNPTVPRKTKLTKENTQYEARNKERVVLEQEDGVAHSSIQREDTF